MIHVRAFCFRQGACGFLDARMKPVQVNDYATFHRPKAKVLWPVCIEFGRRLTLLHCDVRVDEVLRDHENEFKIVFLNPPHLETEQHYPSLEIKLDDLNTHLVREKKDPVSDMRRFVNEHGAEALCWAVHAITKRPYAYKLTPSELLLVPVTQIIP